MATHQRKSKRDGIFHIYLSLSLEMEPRWASPMKYDGRPEMTGAKYFTTNIKIQKKTL